MQLLEREDELERLEGALARAEGGEGRVVLVRGEAGIGKTALVRAFAQANQDVARILWGACDDLLTPRPLGPIWDIAETEEPSLLGALRDTDRTMVFSEVLDLLRSGLRPTVVVIEDAHWVDAATLDLIRHVGRRIATTHGLLVLTYRDEQMTTDHPLRLVVGDLQPETVSRMQLHPLSASSIATLAAQHGRESADLVAETGGNPFFIHEVLESAEDSLPASISDAVVARASRLSTRAREILELTAVVPGRIEQWLIDGLLDYGTSDLEECEQTGLLDVGGGSISFRHELARRAIEESLSSVRRQQLNRLIVGALIDVDAASSRIVHHAHQAGDIETLVEFLPVAASRASAVASHSESLSHYRLLADLLDHYEDTERAALLGAWSLEEYISGDAQQALVSASRAVELRRSLGDPERLGAALRWLSRVNWWTGNRAAAEACASEAVSVLETIAPGPELASAYSSMAQLAMLAWDVPEAVALSDKAIEAAKTLGAKEALAHAMVNKGTALAIVGYPDGMDLLRQAVDMAMADDVELEVTRGYVNLAWSAIEARDLAVAEPYLEAALTYAAERDLAGFEDYCHATRAWLKLLRGDWYGAEDDARTADSHPGRAGINASPQATWLGLVAARRGRPDAAELLARAWELAVETTELQRTGHVAVARAEYEWIEGRRQLIEELTERPYREALNRDVASLAGELAFWRWKAGIDEPLPDLVPEPYRLAIEGDWKGAANAWQTLGCPYDRALALMDGDDEAKLLALEILDDLGAIAVAAKWRSELRESGVQNVPRGPSRATQEHPGGLTARQAEVLELMAQDLTNLEIADELFVSRRTVDHHVSAVLTKLGASSRHEAVSEAERLGMLTFS